MTRKKSVRPVSVLRGVNTVNKSRKPTKLKGSTPPTTLTTTSIAVDNPQLIRIRGELDRLFASCSPLDSKAVRKYLSCASSADQMMLDAWARCGREDRKRTVNLSLTEAARRTITPMGIACLVSYARAWIDEAEAQQLAITAVASSSSPSADGGSTRRGSGRPQESRGPATG